MKNKIVTQARFHVGVNTAGRVLNSVDAKKDKASLELTPVGVWFSVSNTRGELEERLVPFSNILQISVVPEAK